MTAEQSPITALVVDDLQANRKLLSTILRRQGVQVIEAQDGQEAVDVFKREHIDLIFMDIMMPRMDGYEASRQIKQLQNGRFVPIIIVSAVDQLEGLEEGISAGADDFISKPIDTVLITSKLLAMERIRQLHLKLSEQYRELEKIEQHLSSERVLAESIFNTAMSQNSQPISNVHVTIKPAELLSGDLVLQARKPDGGWVILVGDFTGHGLPAAIGVVPVSETFHAMVAKSLSSADILYELNNKLCRFLPVNMFMGCLLISYDAGDCGIDVWNGGMPDILVKDCNSGRIKQSMASFSMPLGIDRMQREDLVMRRMTLEEEDCLVAFSDGLIESPDAHFQNFGMQRVTELVESNSAETLSDNIFSELLARRSPDKRLHDDITLVVIGDIISATAA